MSTCRDQGVLRGITGRMRPEHRFVNVNVATCCCNLLHLLIIRLVPHHLRCHVSPTTNSAGHGINFGSVSFSAHQLADAEVRNLDFQVLCQQQVQRLQVSVHNSAVVQEVQGPPHAEAPLQHLHSKPAKKKRPIDSLRGRHLLEARPPDGHIMLLPLGHEVALQVTTRQELRDAPGKTTWSHFLATLRFAAHVATRRRQV